jgi:catechol 2,3-dioxygenase-like lactoylglutathione lyase family enzyme
MKRYRFITFSKGMGMAAIRYIVDDVEQAVSFYRDLLGFVVEMQAGQGFAALQKDDLRLYLNIPGAGGAGSAGGAPEPGGWNRFQLEVTGLDAVVARLRSDGATFRDDIVSGKGGRQILLEDPAGNPIELFEPAAR